MKTITLDPRMKLMGASLVIVFAATIAPAQGITVTASPAIQLQWPTTTNRAYQLLSAASVSGPYTATGPLIEGTTQGVGTFLPATNAHQFFTVQETNASGMAWLQGTWQGAVWEVLPGSVTNGFIARFTIDNTNRQFTATYSFLTGGGCAASLSLLSYSDTQAQFLSAIQSGSCAGSTVILTRTPNTTNVACNMYVLNVGGAGGLLLKQ